MFPQSRQLYELQGVAAILSAILWPIVLSAILLAYRRQVRDLLHVMIGKVDRAKQIRFGVLEIAENLIETAIAQAPVEALKQDPISAKQVVHATDLGDALRASGVQGRESSRLARRQLITLARDFDNVYAHMARGDERTRKLDEIVAKMRALAVVAKPGASALMRSRQAGQRLAAIAILQVSPDFSYSHWLSERAKLEVPFLFFHAAIAMRQIVLSGTSFDADLLLADAQSALEAVRSFRGGQPDRETIEVLEDTIRRVQPSVTH